ncbi:MAG: hypothetical protein JF614_03055 [Acidobacteria bacterium]|nr:hypothetical protein [Acidobacteriota bacterium]
MNDGQAPSLAEAAYRLARAFGWAPQQLQAMTMAQINMYLHFLNEDAHAP